MTERFWPSESVGVHWGMFPIEPRLNASEFSIPEGEIIHGASVVPLGAIVNGRAFIERLEMNYRFEDGGRPLSLNAEWDELKRCFEYMADSLARQAEPVPMEKCLKAMRDARPSRIVTFQKVERRGGDEPVITGEKVEYLVTDESKAKAVLDAAGVPYVG